MTFADGGLIPPSGSDMSGRLPLLIDAVQLLGDCQAIRPSDVGDRHRALLRKINAPLLWEGDQA